jgi:hypothetical protein
MMLMEKASSILSGVGLEKELWEEEVGTTCYWVHISPSLELDDKNPQEVWNGRKPSVTHLKVFGYEVYVHVQKENMSKLDKKAETCIYIG